MGSKSDLPKLQTGLDLLGQLGIPFEVRILSAHRTPEQTAEWASTAAERGIRVLIAAAGGAAHLAGAVAAQTLLPVIGIPVAIEPFQGLDSLLSTVQMPAGMPVATVAAGPSGATNAALLAAQIIAITDPEVRQRLREDREARIAKTLAADRSLRKG
jgi:phosphoribosylaminoimidazole carboxylase PurE protein